MSLGLARLAKTYGKKTVSYKGYTIEVEEADFGWMYSIDDITNTKASFKSAQEAINEAKEWIDFDSEGE